MKKFSEYMAERKANEPPSVTEATSVETHAAEGPISVPAKPKGSDYYSLLEEFGVKSVLDLDEAKFEEFHVRLVSVLNEATK